MPNLYFELEAGRAQGRIICGVDEAGRGPLAGPVVAAACILPAAGLADGVMDAIDDSKKLTATKRERLFAAISAACPHAIAEASVEEIDHHNILGATHLAMVRAIEALPIRPDLALIDGNRAPKTGPKTHPCAMQTLVKGDQLSLSIAAASILAKVTRDRLMRTLAEQNPGYGWEKNAGYGTAQHLDAIKILGVTVWHRRSFAPVRESLL